MAASCVMNSVARKYAKAFYNLYGYKFSNNVIERILQFVAYLRSNRRLLAFLNLPIVSYEQKVSVLYAICDRALVPEEVKMLVKALLCQRRIEILRDVLILFVLHYRRQCDIIVCTVTTSIPLPVQEQQRVQNLMSEILDATIIAEFAVSSTLIKGIRIQSDNILLECSVARHLRALEHAVLQRVRLW